VLTAQQIVALVCQICNCPGRTVAAGQFLNLILADYAQTLDLDSIRLDSTLSIGPQATTPYFYSLPTNYLRMYDIYYNVLGTVFVPKQFELSELDAEYTASGIDNYPVRYATDMSKAPPNGTAPLIAFYPPPAVPITVQFRYRPTSLDIVTPESSSTVPYFPDQLVLIKELCIQVGDVAGGDDRSARWQAEVDKRMRKYLTMDDDKEGYSQTVQLDSRFFRRNVNLPPSKILGF
jgi:hypothetical protein